MQQDATPATQHLILIGGGHAHAIALKMIAMQKPAGVNITLISNLVQTPYSGMLPGLIAGHYNYDQVHIDLGRFCRYAGINFIEDSVTGIDPLNQTVRCQQHPDFHYDLLSIDTGSSPDLDSIPGAREWSIGVKPVNPLLSYWDSLQQKILRRDDTQPLHIGTVGGGASAVEILLAMQYKLQKLLTKRNRDCSQLHFHIVCGPQDVLSSHNHRVRAYYERVIAERGIHLHRAFRVSEVKERRLLNAQGQSLHLDEIIWATAASGARWPAAAGLRCSDNGCILVEDTLQSVSHANIFACGDIADMINHPRPKAGVFAVRQGKPLAHNLLAFLNGSPLQPFTPQRQFLSLISTGDRFAVASRGRWSIAGAWVWRWKNRIDQAFMRGFAELTMLPDAALPADAITIEAPQLRCGGCGAKVGHSILQKVLSRLPRNASDHALIGLQQPDDAAVIEVPPGKLLVQSVDSLRQLIGDDYLFGQVVANHALGDLFAMGATPHSAQAIVTLPYAADAILEQRLLHLLEGACKVFQACNVSLIGGHTSEGAELSLGFAVNGLADATKLLTKQALQAGDKLIITKPLGSGTLFASDMRGQAQGRWIQTALAQMLLSNYPASRILVANRIRACTDVTGFGIAGHLLEMLNGTQLSATVQLDNLPLLEGADLCLRAGLFSSLQPQNRKVARQINNLDDYAGHRLVELLFDPQTAGGLLAAVAADQVETVLTQLREAGFEQSCVIGTVTARSGATTLTLR